MLVCFAWIFFRANSISDLGVIIGKLFTDYGGDGYFAHTFASMGLDLTAAISIALSVYILYVLDKHPMRKLYAVDAEAAAVSASLGYAYIIWLIIAAAALILSHGGASTFIYFQF